MDKTEAKLTLEQELSRYRELSYAELRALIGHIEAFERGAPSGTNYQIEIEVVFDDIRAKRDLRVLGAIDDGGWRSFAPLSDSFIMAPDGSFVGE